jgi:hypothetical protein
MVPPYKLVDMATDRDVPDFVGMDTDPGRYIEVYSGQTPSSPSARISSGALQRPSNARPPDPIPPDPTPPDPGPPGGNGMSRINNETELRQALQAAAGGSRIVVDPTSPPVTVSQKIVITVSEDNFYFDGSGLRIATAIASYDHLFEFSGGRPGLRLKNLYVTGDYPNRRCGDAIRLINAHAGNETAFYNFSLSGIRIEHVAGNGLYMEGGFEGSIDLLETNDCGKTGFVIGCGTSGGSTVCQVNVHNAQMSRCDGWGAEQINNADQVTWFSPKFVNNGMGGLHATDGIHMIYNPQGENTGETLIVVDKQNWSGAEVNSLQCASDGAWTRNWVTPHTGPTKYGIKCPSGAVTHSGVFKGRAYGGGPVSLWAPGAQTASADAYKAPNAQYDSTKPEGQHATKERRRR